MGPAFGDCYERDEKCAINSMEMADNCHGDVRLVQYLQGFQ